VTVVRKRATPFTIRLRGRSGALLKIEARNARGKVLDRSTHEIVPVARGKRDIRSGGDVRSGAGVVVAE
jgi:hypothetical protein